MANEIFLEVNKIRYSGFTNVTVNKSLDQFARSFSATLVSKELFIGEERIIENPIKVGDEVQVYIDEQLITTGYVESLDIDYSADSHSISVAGRDKAGDLIDSSIIAKTYQVRNLKRLIELVLKDNGYSNIKVSQQAASIDNLEANEKVEAESNDTIFSFLDRYAKKVQVLLTTDENGDIVLTQEGSTKAATDLVSLKRGDKNNIKSARLSLNTQDRYRFIEVYSQSTNDSFSENTVSQDGKAEDTDIRSPRRIRVISSIASETAILKEAAKWQLNVRRAKGLSYKCTVVNFLTEGESGDIWDINQTVNIKDDKCSLDGEFLISGVTFTKSNDGSTTQLTIVNKGSYTTDPLSLVSKDLGNEFFA
jgi:prophage tail gpP-like protein